MEFPFMLSADYIDEQYRQWKTDPDSVSREWQVFFEGFELGSTGAGEAPEAGDQEQVLRQAKVDALVRRYRDLGHLLACLDPLSACPTDHPLLRLDAFSLTRDDLDRVFFFPAASGEMERKPLRSIIEILRETYCRSVGVEYMHLQDPDERRWLRERMEPTANRPSLSGEEKLGIYEILCRGTLFEEFLQAKYMGQKRFSLEGAEGVLVVLDTLIRHMAEQGAREILLGMAHRGRLNVKVHIFGSSYESMFREFEECYNPEALVGSGDVKYHRGFISDVSMPNGKTLRMVMADNPSHLESVTPVVEGLTRARQDRRRGENPFSEAAPVLIHGDAAFAGQGVVAETLNMSQLEGYRTGGTVHIIINNQIGFTTLPEDARSTRYSTDLAKMLMVPIFHVHAEDPEALAHVTRLACDYRLAFQKDVVMDVVCYRRHGHNEGDEPYFTQPQMYDRIKERPPAHRLYSQSLLEEDAAGRDELDEIQQRIRRELDAGYQASQESCPLPTERYFQEWEGMDPDYSHEPVETGWPREHLLELSEKIYETPETFTVQSKLQRIFKRRMEAVQKGSGIDWAQGELLAFATLLTEGFPVRLSGEDSRRGTFSHRHSILTDPDTGEHYVPLNHLQEGQAPFRAYDSLLSEYGALGFEYGYSLPDPNVLTIWEAQFGDFANGAQIVIDQYIVAAQAKWHRQSGLTLLLPHGYEGMGAEHSSARLERFLQLCAGDNIQVCYPTTPAQYFHLLRRQMKRSFRKPLVIMSPKSLLRHPQAVSDLERFTNGGFMEVAGEQEARGGAKRCVLCSGKVYYDLLKKRQELESADVALVRLEQLYPFPGKQLKRQLEACREAEQWVWVQEESENMGAWTFVGPRIESVLGEPLHYIGRKASSSPATGYLTVHKTEQAALVDAVFDMEGSEVSRRV